MSIADVMTVEVVSVTPRDTVSLAIGKMVDADIGAVAVCDEGVLVGIFTERDVLRLAARGTPFTHLPVAEVMTRKPVCVAPDDDVVAVADLMRSRTIRHMPVVEDGRLLGITGARDVMGVLVERLWRSHDERAHETARALLRRH